MLRLLQVEVTVAISSVLYHADEEALYAVTPNEPLARTAVFWTGITHDCMRMDAFPTSSGNAFLACALAFGYRVRSMPPGLVVPVYVPTTPEAHTATACGLVDNDVVFSEHLAGDESTAFLASCLLMMCYVVVAESATLSSVVPHRGWDCAAVTVFRWPVCIRPDTCISCAERVRHCIVPVA